MDDIRGKRPAPEASGTGRDFFAFNLRILYRFDRLLGKKMHFQADYSFISFDNVHFA